MSFKRGESHTFSRVPQVHCQRSEFDRSHGCKTTFDSGFLVPIFVDEVSPGDTHKLDANFFARLATLQKPIMDNLYLESFWFFTPARLLWDNWQRMWGEQDNPGDSTDFLVPYVDMGAGAAEGSIWDYFGVPIGVPGLRVNALYPRAMNLVWNQWFRDQNLQDSLPIHKGDGPDPIADYNVVRRGKRHDYFTSCLPFPQKGPEVLLPLAGQLPVVPEAAGAFPTFKLPGGAISDASLRSTPGVPSGNPTIWGWTGAAQPTTQDPALWEDPGLVANLAAGITATINDFRQAVVVQQFYETIARGGSRYVELLQAVYGVSNGDARLQRPEYLGGGRTAVMVNPVVNTAGAGGSGPGQGNLAAYGVASSRSENRHGFTKSFTEHGILLGLICVRADLNYQQGLLRQFSRRTKFDYLIPHFAHLGEQPVLNKEIFAQGPGVLNPGGTPVDEDVFGYVSRYDDYRYKPSMVTGMYRSAAATSLDFWHLAQDFADLPVLSPEFIEENPPVDRVIQTPDEPHFLLDSWIGLKSVRELPMYSVPGLRRI